MEVLAASLASLALESRSSPSLLSCLALARAASSPSPPIQQGGGRLRQLTQLPLGEELLDPLDLLRLSSLGAAGRS